MLASSHTSVLINHCSAQLRMHTRATTFPGQALARWGGPGDCGLWEWDSLKRDESHTHMTHRPTLTGTHTRHIRTRCENAWSPVWHKVEDCNFQTSEVAVLYLAVGVDKWSKRGTGKPQWLSAHVVTVVLVTALKFFLLLFPHLRKY